MFVFIFCRMNFDVLQHGGIIKCLFYITFICSNNNNIFKLVSFSLYTTKQWMCYIHRYISEANFDLQTFYV